MGVVAVRLIVRESEVRTSATSPRKPYDQISLVKDPEYSAARSQQRELVLRLRLISGDHFDELRNNYFQLQQH